MSKIIDYQRCIQVFGLSGKDFDFTEKLRLWQHADKISVKHRANTIENIQMIAYVSRFK